MAGGTYWGDEWERCRRGGGEGGGRREEREPSVKRDGLEFAHLAPGFDRRLGLPVRWTPGYRHVMVGASRSRVAIQVSNPNISHLLHDEEEQTPHHQVEQANHCSISGRFILEAQEIHS